MELSRQAAQAVVSGACEIGHIEKTALIDIIKNKYGTSFDLINIG